ncbi:MAG: hypothetical protein HBSAPP02_00110 [Phycisphaerae bacterium]|nr:MAG: flagellar biosynthesis anti-sigma factor FlgM [Planctomycetia bacterium]RIK67534.1 MAG: hypothetical protein DCC66_11465 [Planctomycetota bacterium]GJQ24979.1 MAG: hypothetical protein HBSAPP02_00110 [Phycisphaerae bacterium]
MMDVSTIGNTASPATVRDYFNQSFRSRSDNAGSAVVDDRVEISEIATILSRLAELPEANARRIVEIRREIQSGTYLTADKLDGAIDGLLSDL